MGMTDTRAWDMTKWKAISKVMGWGLILNMIRDKNGTQETGEGW
jgi:hypothetical protein